MTPGLAVATSAYPRPKRAIVPGARFSTSTSADVASSKASVRSAGSPRSSHTERLLRLTDWKYVDVPSSACGGPQDLVSSPRGGRSTLMTSAPRSPSIIVA